MEAMQTGAHGRRPTPEAFTSLAQNGILDITKRCNPVLSVGRMVVIGFIDRMCVA
jgi:hypothetical protein